LGNLEPIMVVGLRRVLADGGIDVIGEEHSPSAVVTEARRLQPDAVLLDHDDAEGRALGERIRRVAPLAKVILWARDETFMQVLDPATDGMRWVELTAAGGLRSELSDSGHRPQVED
jgi:DNA-binding NarL/FixJ family response regulator